MTITNAITSIIDSLEKSTDPAAAYFSFTTDESGEHGAIRANKDGLRQYALELLKKSLEMEERKDGKSLCFPPYEWMISDAGYDLIRSVRPEYVSRTEIMASTQRKNANIKMSTEPAAKKGCLGMMLALVISLCTLAAAITAFS